jgi:hypothetical protein
MEFRTLINIDTELSGLIAEIKRYFSLDIDDGLVERIVQDSKTDNVNEKHYKIFEEKSRPTILATVDEYEPETIWIEIKNIKNTDVKHFNDLWVR